VIVRRKTTAGTRAVSRYGNKTSAFKAAPPASKNRPFALLPPLSGSEKASVDV
jgi:hypothetical protein